MTKLYKFLDDTHAGGYSDYVWPVKGDGTTDWLECTGELKMCENGFHLCKPGHLTKWIQSQLYVAEYDGEYIDGDDKLCCRRVRLIGRVDAWNERTQRLFACDCAERVLPIFEERFPDDKRPREAIEVARRYANGAATEAELAAAWDAAWDAAWAAARAAAWGAVRAAAEAATWAAAWDVAWTAAWAAARDAAEAATWAAAWDVAWTAAWAAARDAERVWQEQRLLEYVEGQGE